MFRGGDYYDEPKFLNPLQVKNTMDISVSFKPVTNGFYAYRLSLSNLSLNSQKQDIAGSKPKLNYQTKAQRDNMSVTDINGKPPLHQYSSGVGGIGYS